jgi:hypothetical protein
MKSLLFQDGATPFVEPPGCAAGRQEVTVAIRKDGRVYRYTLRDKITVEDPYLMMLKAAAFSIQTGEPYNGTPPSRSVRDFLIKQSVVI